jgi:hypothetical protein
LISEKAACRPYRCAEHCLRPSGDGKGVGEGRVVGPEGEFLDKRVAGEELEAVVVWVSSHNMPFYESHDCNAVKYCLSHQARFL